LTASLQEWLKLNEQNVITLNLDPGALRLPYAPDVDVREYIDINQLMENYGLGPNGALIVAADLIGDHLEEIKEAIEDTNAEIVLVDTPGQIELFAFRESGPFISSMISEDPKALLFLLDAPFCRNPLNYVSSVYLAMAVYTRILIPQVYAFTKVDLVSQEELNAMLSWSESVEELEYAIETSLGKNSASIGKELARALDRSGLVLEPIPTSAKENIGLIDLWAEITRTLTGGEELRP
ncbi:MAG: ATP/GTP-binding protein, partial [Candidatus Bathyarchaeia archaeon]